MILLTNGDSWTQGDSPAQTINWEATKTLDDLREGNITGRVVLEP